MPLERTEEIRAWATKAMLDLQAAELLFAQGGPMVEPALFHCQQAAEKVLKAYLVSRDLAFSKTHDLVALVTLCARQQPEFVALQDAAIVLTPYAVSFRYPSEMTAPTPQQSNEALDLARAVVSFVRQRLPSDARPSLQD